MQAICQPRILLNVFNTTANAVSILFDFHAEPAHDLRHLHVSIRIPTFQTNPQKPGESFGGIITQKQTKETFVNYYVIGRDSAGDYVKEDKEATYS